ncbi:MAG: very short patch repair endonuclease [Steroidobacteraceae bacterium]
MADVVNAATRSRMMSGIRSRDTMPERLIRSELHRLGFRFRLHSSKIPGRPDLVLPKYRVAVFVHGCFWHGHDCPLFRLPRTRRDFWKAKINRNRERDDQVKQAILEAGWRHLTVWECAFRGGGEDAVARTAKRAAHWLQLGSRRSDRIRGARAR